MTRDDIKISQDASGCYYIDITLSNTSYQTSFTDMKCAYVAIKCILDTVMTKEIGVTKHDFMMKFDDFLSKE